MKKNSSNLAQLTVAFFRLRTWLLFVGLFLFSSLIYTAHVFVAKSVLWGDTHYYYAVARSLVVDHNLNMSNEAFLPLFGFPNQPVFSSGTNRIVNKFSVGAPLLWLPPLMVGAALELGIPFLRNSTSILGYGWFTQWLVGVTTVGFSTLGLAVFFHALSRKFGRKTSFFVSAILLFCTQLFFYTAVDPLNSHSTSFLLSAVLFALSLRWVFEKKEISFLRVLVLGLVAGYLALIRNQDCIFLVPVGILLFLIPASLPKKVGRAIIFLLSSAVPMTLQFASTYYWYGQFTSPYIQGGEKLNWLQPDFLRVLFSQGNGLLFFAPVVVVCLSGLWVGLRKRDAVATAGGVGFLLAMYVIASWGPEIVGGPYGSRMFTSCLPWLGYGLALFLKKYWPIKKNRVWLLTLLFCCCLNTMAQTVLLLLNH